MARFSDNNSGGGGGFGGPGGGGPRGTKVAKESANGTLYVDYKDVEELRRLMSPNGKLHSRKRLGVNARQQRLIAQAVKRARYLGLLPYTNATL